MACPEITVQLPYAIAPTLTWVGDGWAMLTSSGSGALYVHVAIDGTVASPVPIDGLRSGRFPGQLVWANNRVYTVLSTPMALANVGADGQDVHVGSDLGIVPVLPPTLASTGAGFRIITTERANLNDTADVVDVDGAGTLVTLAHESSAMAMCLGDSGNPFVYAVTDGRFYATYAVDLGSRQKASLGSATTQLGDCGTASASGRTLVSTLGTLWSLDGSAATPQSLGAAVAVASDPPGSSVLLANDVTVVRVDENLTVVRTRALAPGGYAYDGALGVGPDCQVVSYATTEGGPATLVQLPR